MSQLEEVHVNVHGDAQHGRSVSFATPPGANDSSPTRTGTDRRPRDVEEKYGSNKGEWIVSQSYLHILLIIDYSSLPISYCYTMYMARDV